MEFRVARGSRHAARTFLTAVAMATGLAAVTACGSPPDLPAILPTTSASSSPASPTSYPTGTMPSSPSHDDPSSPGQHSSSSSDDPGWVQPIGVHPRRDIVLGEEVDLSDEPGYPKVVITVAYVTQQASCPQGPAPRLGQYVALDLIVRRTDSASDNVGITSLEWTALDANEHATKVHSLSGFLCQPRPEQFPLRFQDRDEVRGRLILDVPSDTRTMSATVPWNERAARLLIPLDAR